MTTNNAPARDHGVPLRDFDALLALARTLKPKRIAVAAANDSAVLTALSEAKALGIAEYQLVGDRDSILAAAGAAGVAIDESTIIQEAIPEKAAVRAVTLVHEQKADIVMKGYLHSDDFLRAVLAKDTGLRAGPTISHVFIWEARQFGRLIFVTDGAMNIAPDIVTKANIIMNSVHLASIFGVRKPKVALLAAVEMVNPAMPATLDAATLAKMCDRRQYSLPFFVDGPLALDNALSPEAAAHKHITGPVAGHADILVTPDIEAGNMLSKSFVYLGGGTMAGVLVGAAAPVVLTSRADSARSKLCSIATAILMSDVERNLHLKIGKVHY